MQNNEIAGYATIAIGVLLLLFTFYQAYTLYLNPFVNIGGFSGYLNVNTAQPSGSNPSNASSIASGIGSSIVSSLIRSIPLNAYFFVTTEVLLLFVFASIGYKFTKLGLNLINRHVQPSTSKAQK